MTPRSISNCVPCDGAFVIISFCITKQLHCIIKQLLDKGFVISGTIKVRVRIISLGGQKRYLITILSFNLRGSLIRFCRQQYVFNLYFELTAKVNVIHVT